MFTLSVCAIPVALLVGMIVGTSRVHDRRCKDWIDEMRARAIAETAFSPKRKPFSIIEGGREREPASDVEVALFEREISNAVLQ